MSFFETDPIVIAGRARLAAIEAAIRELPGEEKADATWMAITIDEAAYNGATAEKPWKRNGSQAQTLRELVKLEDLARKIRDHIRSMHYPAATLFNEEISKISQKNKSIFQI